MSYFWAGSSLKAKANSLTGWLLAHTVPLCELQKGTPSRPADELEKVCPFFWAGTAL